jgi:16S rRNA processing protein RimM
MGDARIVIARIGAAHGIKGEVRLQSFTQAPADVAGYGPLVASDGRTFEIVAHRPAAGTSPTMLVVRFKGIGDRNAAEALTGIELSVAKEHLPETEEGEFYHADLVGLRAVTSTGAPIGVVVAVPNYGAGDLLEIAPAKGATILVPFTDAAVPEIDVEAGHVVVVPPVFDTDEGGEA